MEEFYLIKIDRPESLSVKEMKRYIKEAVGNWNGLYPPEDPRFDIKEPKSVKRLPWSET